MPVPGLVLPPVVTQVDEVLTVESKTVRYDPNSQTYTFAQGVKARYGPTVLTADELVVQGVGDEGTGYARGNVRVVDPDGTLNAKNIRFTWSKDHQTGFAEAVDVNFAGVILKADTADITPGVWTLTGVYGTSCLNKPPLFAVRTPKVVLETGKRGKVERPSIYVFGHRLIGLPDQKFNLNPRTQGFHMPNFTYRQDGGFGVNWSSGWLLDPETDLSASFSSFKGDRPGYQAQVARSFVSSDRSTASIAPRSDLSNRLGNSYFENVEQPTPKSEQSALSGVRDSMSVGSYWFQGATFMHESEDYTKPIDIAYERGGVFGPVYGVGQLRAQTIRREVEPIHTRFEANGTVAAKPFQVSRDLALYTRLDGLAYAGGSNSGWLRGQLGMSFHPTNWFTLAGAVHSSLEFGTPLYPIDTLESPRGGTVRLDFDLGPTQASTLWRYDSTMGWYDRQYMVSQVMGCLQPYVLYRQWTGDYRLGVNLRLGSIVDVVTRRRIERSAVAPTVLDEPGRGR